MNPYFPTDAVNGSVMLNSKKIPISFLIMQTCAHICMVTPAAYSKWSRHVHKALEMDKMFPNQSGPGAGTF